MDKEVLYHLFSVNIGYLSLIIIKMMVKKSETSNNFFYQKIKGNLYFEREILKNFDDYIGGITRKFDLKNTSDYQLERKKANLKILKKVRITHSDKILDTITFSRDFIDNTDKILEIFWMVSNKKMFFSKSTTENFSKNKNFWEQQSPDWFCKQNFSTIAEWIVVHFEMRIFDL